MSRGLRGLFGLLIKMEDPGRGREAGRGEVEDGPGLRWKELLMRWRLECDEEKSRKVINPIVGMKRGWYRSVGIDCVRFLRFLEFFSSMF